MLGVLQCRRLMPCCGFTRGGESDDEFERLFLLAFDQVSDVKGNACHQVAHHFWVLLRTVASSSASIGALTGSVLTCVQMPM